MLPKDAILPSSPPIVEIVTDKDQICTTGLSVVFQSGLSPNNESMQGQSTSKISSFFSFTMQSLGLGLCDESSKNYCMKIDEHMQQQKKKEEDPWNINKAYPFLTLGRRPLPSTTHDHDANINRQQQAASSPSVDDHHHHHVSSFSNYSSSSSIFKRERSDNDQYLITSSSEEVVVDENGNQIRRRNKKLRLTKQQSSLLEDTFKHHSTLHPKEKQELARKLNLRTRQVEVWFQNRRARTKVKQTEVDCEVMKKWYESLKEENKMLQKELKSIKSSTTLISQPSSLIYVQLPAVASSLTVCPCCKRIIGGGGGGDQQQQNGSSSPTTTTTPPIGRNPHQGQHFYNTPNYTFTQSSAAC